MNVFVYGSLMNAQVMQQVVGKTFAGVPAKLKGFKRLKVGNAPFPAIIQAEDSTVTGLLIQLDDHSQLKTLDLFETDMYKRMAVEVLVDNRAIDANVYVWNREMDQLLDEEWDYDYFVTNLLPYWTDLTV